MSSSSTSDGSIRSATSRTRRFLFSPVSSISWFMLASWSGVSRIDLVFPFRFTMPEEYYSQPKGSTP